MVNLKKYILKLDLLGCYILFLTTLAIVYSNINLHYLSTYSPDFQYYKDYLSYFFGEYENSGREQGLLYFFLVSLFIKLGPNNFSLDNSDQLISNAVQLSNLFLYILGLVGLFYLLKYKGFKTKHILLTFSIVNFFPQSINMIMTMKPEILAFAILPWSIFLILLFFEKNNYKYLYFSLIPNVLLLTTKGTIIGSMLLVYLYILIKEKYKIFTPKFFSIILIFILFLIPILFENFNANGKHIFEHTNDKPEMQDVAQVDLLYNINFRDLYMDPFRHNHANSLVGMVTLDTFGDYFQWYAYHDQSAFMYIKKDFESIWYITHWRQFFSVILTVCLYFYIVYFYRKDKGNRVFYLFPFFGLFILLLQAYGIPQKNFDKDTAELFKTHYYSYLLIICLIFVIINLIKKKNIIGYFLLGLFTLTTSFLYGIPNSDSRYNEYIYSKNVHLDTCIVNSYFLDNFDKNNCSDTYIKICEFDRIIYNTENIISDDSDQYNYKEYLPLQTFINTDLSKVTPQNRDECIQAIKEGYYYDSTYLQSLKIPLVNLTYFLLFLISIIYLINRNFILDTFSNRS